MESRILKALALEAKTTTDPERWARAVCRSASHFGRQGRIKEAMDAMATVRGRFGTNLTPAVGAWLMLAEGVMYFFQERPVEAADRTRRAYGLAAAAKLEHVLPICAAWLAHIDFNAFRFEAMALHLEEALTLASADDHQTQARASLVLADALHFAGDFQAARPWYEKARIHATTEGDEVTLSALLQNVAAMRVGNVRMADAVGSAAPAESKRAMMEANAALYFDIGIGTTLLSALLPLLQGQLLTVEGKFREAEELLSRIDRSKLEAKSVPLLLVDLAWCYTAQGRVDDGVALASEVASQLSPMMDLDEVVCVNARLSQIAEKAGNLSDSNRFRDASRTAYQVHRDQQVQLRQRLDSLSQRAR